MICDILKNSAKKYGNNIAVCCDEKQIRYRELFELVVRMALEMKSFGVEKGDNVAIYMENSIEFVAAFFAINMCEAVIMPLYHNTASNRVPDLIKFYDIKFIITKKKHLNKLYTEELKDCEVLSSLFCLDGGNFSCEYSKDKSDENETYSTNQIPENVALILLSSGTTSMPKGIMLSDDNILSNVESISKYFLINDKDRLLSVKNITHSSSITGEMLASIFNGCTLFLTSKLLTSSLILELINRYSITVFVAVPTIISSMISNKNFESVKLDSLRIIKFSGSNINHSYVKRLAEKFPSCDLINAYGLTEASPRLTYVKRDDLLAKDNCAGKPISGVEVFVIDKDENTVESNIIGEVAVKGPNIMQGYYKNEILTRKVLNNGLLHTGDLGYMDDEGFLYITGRKDNMVIISGKNVYPEEIENTLCHIKGVKEVLVRGEDDELLGQKIVAYVVCSDGYTLDTREVIQHCKNNLDDYKIPREIFFINNLQKTGSGKIIRNQVIKND